LLSLLATVVAIIFLVVVPNEIVAHKSTVGVLVCTVVGFYLLVNSVFHYVMAWRTPAGRPPTVSPLSLIVRALAGCAHHALLGHLSHVRIAEATTHAPLPAVRHVHPQDGSPLPYAFGLL